MQEHPFLARAQIYFGNPEQEIKGSPEDFWSLSLESIQPKFFEKSIGLVFIWEEESLTNDLDVSD